MFKTYLAMWYIGQKVVCVDNKPKKDASFSERHSVSLLQENHIYTIIGLGFQCGCIKKGIRVLVIGSDCLCGHCNRIINNWEPVFRDERFLSLDEYTEMNTQIEELVKPEKVKI